MAICGDTRKQKNLLFFVFFWLWRCGDMWRYPKNLKKQCFLKFFPKAVAICGDMWRYPKTRKSVIFCIFLVVALWRYVAICGDTPKIKKIKKSVFLKFFS